jgi:hypothetical protein
VLPVHSDPSVPQLWSGARDLSCLLRT